MECNCVHGVVGALQRIVMTMMMLMRLDIYVLAV